MKLDKTLIYISSFLLVVMILIAGYFVINNYVNPEQKKGTISVEKGEILNINTEKKKENPTKEDIENLIEELQKKNNQLKSE